MKIDRRSMLVCVAMAASFTFCNAFAHITNEASQGPDVGASGLGGDIMLLVVAEIMPETPDFAPDAPLSRFDLASWAALAADLGEGGETPDTDALATAALQQGLVESIEGQATYEEINDLLFHGQLADYRPAATPTGGGSGTLYRRTIVHSGRRDAAPKTRPAIWPGRRGCPGGVAE